MFSKNYNISSKNINFAIIKPLLKMGRGKMLSETQKSVIKPYKDVVLSISKI